MIYIELIGQDWRRDVLSVWREAKNQGGKLIYDHKASQGDSLLWSCWMRKWSDNKGERRDFLISQVDLRRT